MTSFPFVLLQFFGCLSISRLLNTGKNSNDFPLEITSFSIFFTSTIFISTFRLLLKNSANFSLQFKSLLTLLSHYKQANLTFSHHIFRSVTFSNWKFCRYANFCSSKAYYSNTRYHFWMNSALLPSSVISYLRKNPKCNTKRVYLSVKYDH